MFSNADMNQLRQGKGACKPGKELLWRPILCSDFILHHIIFLNILDSIMVLIRYLLQSDFLKQISLFLAPDLLCVEMNFCRNHLFLITVTWNTNISIKCEVSDSNHNCKIDWLMFYVKFFLVD